jgi:hypothetical protein
MKGRKSVQANDLLQVDFCPFRGPDAPFARFEDNTTLIFQASHLPYLELRVFCQLNGVRYQFARRSGYEWLRQSHSRTYPNFMNGVPQLLILRLLGQGEIVPALFIRGQCGVKADIRLPMVSAASRGKSCRWHKDSATSHWPLDCTS